MLKTRDAVSKVKLDGKKQTFTEEQLDKLILEPDTRSCDGNFYICASCKKTIKSGGWPRLNEKYIGTSVASLPPHLQTEDMILNKLEAYLLKLQIPFIRMAHIPRSAEFKVIGPLIVVEGNVEDTMNDLLPRPQRLVPVALKRKLEYSGSYIAEVVDKEKIRAYYNYFKTVNPLFKNEDLSDKAIDQFIADNLKSIEEQDEQKIILDENQNVADSTTNDAGLLSVEKEEKVDENLPEHLTEIAMDSLIYPNIGQREGTNTIAENMASAIVYLDKESGGVSIKDASSSDDSASDGSLSDESSSDELKESEARPKDGLLPPQPNQVDKENEPSSKYP